MTMYLKRFFLLLFFSVACLFFVNQVMPSAGSVHATGVLATRRQVHPSASRMRTSSSVSSYVASMQAVTPTVVPTTAPVTPTVVPTTVPPTPTVVPTTAPTATAPVVPTTVPVTPTATAPLAPTPTTIPTPLPKPTATPGGNTNTTSSHAALNAMIFTMGGAGILLVIIGMILYFVYSNSTGL